MHAIILSIGDELVLGQTVDTNAAWLSARLAQMGIATSYHQTLADDQDVIVQAIRLAAEQADVLLITGGLGPTDDDLTRSALAAAMGRELVVHAESLATLERFFADRGRPMPERNKLQALHPAGTTMIPNPNGTAPGLKAVFGRATIYVTPGVPREMCAMYEQSIEPELRCLAGDRDVILTAKLNTFGAGEATVADLLGELMDRRRNPKVGTTVSGSVVSVRVRSEFPDPVQAQDELDRTIMHILARLGPIVFGRDDEPIQVSVAKLLERRGKHLVTAESCTGGLIGQMISDVPGCSASYLGGWITYSNSMKLEQLGVERAALDAHGAVSEPVARAMAEGAIRHCHGADVGVSVTGIAGPDGGTPEKPVGTVWIGLAERDERMPEQFHTQAVHFLFHGERDVVRDRAAKSALQLLRLHLMGEPSDRMPWGRSGVRATEPSSAPATDGKKE